MIELLENPIRSDYRQIRMYSEIIWGKNLWYLVNSFIKQPILCFMDSNFISSTRYWIVRHFTMSIHYNSEYIINKILITIIGVTSIYFTILENKVRTVIVKWIKLDRYNNKSTLPALGQKRWHYKLAFVTITTEISEHERHWQ